VHPFIDGAEINVARQARLAATIAARPPSKRRVNK
jgi:hypothetical protein